MQGIRYKDEGVHDTYIYDTNEDYLSGILIESYIDFFQSRRCFLSYHGRQQLINVSDRLGVKRKQGRSRSYL